MSYETITLHNVHQGAREFDLLHAQNILQLQAEKKLKDTWDIPGDSPFEFTENILRLKKSNAKSGRNKKTDSEASE